MSIDCLKAIQSGEHSGAYSEMKRRAIFKSFAIFGFGCTEDGNSSKSTTLIKPIGIETADGEFTILIPASQRLPHVFSETFTNKNDGGPEIQVHLSQKDEFGSETVAFIIVQVPPSPDNSQEIVVTLKISADKKMQVKTTVVRTASVQEFGPFPVD